MPIESNRDPLAPSLRVVVLVITVSAPLALGFETLLRVHVLARIIGPELDEVRAFFSPITTKLAWCMAGLTLVAGVIGLGMGRRALAGLAGERDPSIRRRKSRDRLLLSTSIPQVPAILATLCFMAGARLTPVLVAMVISTVFVLAEGWLGRDL